MAVLQSPTDLKEYCLRKLGSPVINIEIDAAQAMERVEEAISFFIERHYNGTEEVYFKHNITSTDVSNGYITMPHEYVALTEILSAPIASSGEAMFNFQYRFMRDLNDRMIGSASTGTISDYYISMSHLDLMSNMLTPIKTFWYNSVTNRLQPKWQWSDVGSLNLLKSGNDLTGVEWTSTNSTLTQNDNTDPHSTQKAGTVTSNAAGLFSISQTITSKDYIRGTFTFSTQIRKGTYNGNLTLTVKDSMGTTVFTKSITPGVLWAKDISTFTYNNAHANDFVITLEGNATAAGESFALYNPWNYANAIVIFRGYKALNTATDVNVYNERWVKEYSTALVKQQWGTNIKKFEGVQMPGGVTLNGQSIYDEATTEIENLRDKFLLEYEEQPTGGWW